MSACEAHEAREALELRCELQDKYETLVSMLRDVSDELAEEVHREAAQMRVVVDELRAENTRLQQCVEREREERERTERANAALAAEVESTRGECVEFELSALRTELAHIYDRSTAAERESELRAQIAELRGRSNMGSMGSIAPNARTAAQTPANCTPRCTQALAELTHRIRRFGRHGRTKSETESQRGVTN
jgi:chromosome segregation ATPase